MRLVCLLLFTFAASAQNLDKFRPLDERWPTPNANRSASGAPGPAYWQQQVDYDIDAALDETAHRITGNGRPVEMGPTEFRLLHWFITHPERVYSRAQLLDEVWGDHVFVEERTVDVHIRRLRQALEPTGHDRLLETIRGTGYRFCREIT